MNLKKLEEDLNTIVEKRIALSKISYADEAYDDIEEEMHDLEDDFNEEYGDELEDILEKIYAQLKSDNEVLLPSAYLANEYSSMMPDASGRVTYEVVGKEGVPVESEQFDKMDVRLVLVPNPARFILQINGKSMKDLWVAK
ncbi:hypothetical protein [Cecembia lonarensis]|uniref:Uncharacterized protein n=1 Tax=Cecembia lonarensis (strain CCUG 58316 / KCTC 22772 / LW9) TaxID=1225176 RepID=K1KTK3_CECL9|nr:hypothetical protein [Cecembia lonarensis]EKB47520.1 hypothetical protein B879_03882 [Cecembia lonarensis LW9]